MLTANASQVKALHLPDFRSAFKKVDWKSLRDVDFRGAKHALRGDLKDQDTESRSRVIFAAAGAAALGAALMYFFDPGLGESRRSSARGRLEHWYLSGRGHFDHSWRQPRSETPAFDLTEKGRLRDDPTDMGARTPREEVAAPPR